MTLKLNNNKVVNIKEFSQRYIASRQGGSKRNMIINIIDEMSFDEISALFTAENVSKMTLTIDYKNTEIVFNATDIENIDVSITDEGIQRLVYLY